MCDFSKGFKLCTCDDKKTVIHNKNSRRYKRQNRGKIEYIWKLHHYIEEQSQMMVGIYRMPKSNIGCSLTVDFVLYKLNNFNVFDFDIEIVEGDTLFIQEKNKADNHLAFIYKNGEWINNHYSPFLVITKEYLNGSISKID